MTTFEVEIAHFNGLEKEISFKHALPEAARIFLKSPTKGKAEEWVKNNEDIVVPPWLCPFNCSGKNHKFVLKEVRVKDVPKNARIVNLK